MAPVRLEPAEPNAQATGSGRTRPIGGPFTVTAAAFAALAASVLAFTGGWARGDLVIDGPGIVVYVRLALRYLLADGRVPYWLPDMWAGSPVWAIGPSFPAFILLPIAALTSPETAVKAGIVGLQVLGAWGAFVLVRSLWRSVPAALVAGLVYGISPLVISHAALSGSESTMGVIAAAPWLTWALRHGLRGRGTRYLVAAGGVAAFAVLHQAEYAYGLALLGFFQLAGELGRIRTERRAGRVADATVRQLLGRTALAVAVCLGLIAHWIVPFLTLSKSFVLSPPELVQGELLRGVGHAVGQELGYFLHRSGALNGVVSVYRENLLGYALYLGVVPVGLTCLSAVLLARRRDDRTFSGVLVATGVALWLSTGAVALAFSGPVLRGQLVPMIVLGGLSGAVTGGFVRRLGLGRAAIPALATVLVALIAVPYLTPFLTLQRLVPLLKSIRFSRFYVITVLALALGTAWPVAHLARWLPQGRPALRRWAPGVLATLLAVAVLADAWPYRSFYWLRQPSSADAYRAVTPQLDAMAPGTRISTPSQDPRTVDILLRQHKELSLGWPHPVAYGQIWRLTIGAAVAPFGYGDAALGLSSTAFILGEQTANRSTAREAVSGVTLTPVHALPRARAYDRTVVMGDQTITPELATGLASRNVGVVSSARAPVVLGDSAVATVPSGRSCDPTALAPTSAGARGEIGIACGMHQWIQAMAAGGMFLGPEDTPGSSFTAVADGLRAVSVWMEGRIGTGTMVVREVGSDGGPGREVARTRITGVDPYGMALFGFEPIADSAGKRYTFAIECPDCFSELEPQALAARNVYRQGNLTVNGRIDPDHTLAFAPAYERLGAVAPSSTTVRVVGSGPGHWKLQTSGVQPALVVVSDADFPGWRAHVDGRSAPVLEADGAFIGVAVGAGDHKITFDYGPGTAALIGRLITFGTLLAVAIGGLLSRRRRRPGDALEVGAPTIEPGGQEALDVGQDRPGPAVADGQRPGTEGDQAVLAAGDHGQPGVGQHGEQ